MESARSLYNAAAQERRDEWNHAKRLAALFGADRPDKAALRELDSETLDDRRHDASEALHLPLASTPFSDFLARPGSR